MIGGQGERKTLRLVARYGDACNLFPADLATVRHKLRGPGRTTARREGVIRPRWRAPSSPAPTGSPTRTASDGSLEAYAGLGFSMVWVGPPPGASDPVGWLTELTESRLPELARPLAAP